MTGTSPDAGEATMASQCEERKAARTFSGEMFVYRTARGLARTIRAADAYAAWRAALRKHKPEALFDLNGAAWVEAAHGGATRERGVDVPSGEAEARYLDALCDELSGDIKEAVFRSDLKSLGIKQREALWARGLVATAEKAGALTGLGRAFVVRHWRPRCLPWDVHANDLPIGPSECPACRGASEINCPSCEGSGYRDSDETLVCRPCGGQGVETCKPCDGSGTNERTLVAKEATRLWHRDIGREVFDGGRQTYIRLAVESYRAGEIGGAR